MNQNTPSTPRGRRAMVRLAEPAAPADEPARRRFLQRAVACGAAWPAVYGLAGEARAELMAA
ncbi:MAG TPA: hypothetical protein VFH22_11645, partial [Rhodocyclaceae bacterium]|nr:hypothetical protein [Rhodocyclaceae bacterium]